jgi:hypothetical protein
MNVTLHMMLHSAREPIPDVPAIYFVQPTEDNIERICTDLKAGLYDSMHLNFSSELPRCASVTMPPAACGLPHNTTTQRKGEGGAGSEGHVGREESGHWCRPTLVSGRNWRGLHHSSGGGLFVGL